MTIIVAVIGGPGSGKSTLCTALARHYIAAGQDVDHFEEQEILTRPDFSKVASEFANGAGSVAPQTLIAAFAQYVDRSLANDIDLVITDALIPFIPSLLVWGHSETQIEQVIAELEKVSATATVIVILLVGDPALTLPRAIDREGEGWFESYVHKLSRWPGASHVVDLSTAIDQLRHEADLSRRLVSRSTWELLEIDATSDPDTLIETAQRKLDAILPT
ncbi:MAG TPA: hypothetical protein VIP98_03095 [Microlunatus sp.]